MCKYAHTTSSWTIEQAAPPKEKKRHQNKHIGPNKHFSDTIMISPSTMNPSLKCHHSFLTDQCGTLLLAFCVDTLRSLKREEVIRLASRRSASRIGVLGLILGLDSRVQLSVIVLPGRLHFIDPIIGFLLELWIEILAAGISLSQGSL